MTDFLAIIQEFGFVAAKMPSGSATATETISPSMVSSTDAGKRLRISVTTLPVVLAIMARLASALAGGSVLLAPPPMMSRPVVPVTLSGLMMVSQ